MKKSTLSIAVGAASAALIVSSGAMAYDSFDMNGTSSLETHSTKAYFPGDLDATQAPWGTITPPQPGLNIECGVGGTCDLAQGPGNAEVFSYIEITNKTLGGVFGAPGANGPAAVDTYTVTSADYDASGNVVSGDIDAVNRIYQHLHGTTAGDPGLLNLNSPAKVPEVFNITTSKEGKIIGGDYGFFTVLPAPFAVTWAITDWDANISVTFAGGTNGTNFECMPDITDAKAVIAQIDNGNGTQPTGLYGRAGEVAGCVDDWSFGSQAYVSYETCDVDFECGQFGKSVPVPAFAAAALGLGLIGITLLTGRRRAIK